MPLQVHVRRHESDRGDPLPFTVPTDFNIKLVRNRRSIVKAAGISYGRVIQERLQDDEIGT